MRCLFTRRDPAMSNDPGGSGVSTMHRDRAAIEETVRRFLLRISALRGSSSPTGTPTAPPTTAARR